ncbi:polyamine-transporting ATPase 13A3-like isoform X1 [Amphibalanus amphitrite]|uniref:polyamine-transporting ATPase 13A3-like isoform X1 n=2 Tax=Amphibalanus amphitrite TaxID=1232801 RepID=UPI001C92235B|nr:polyamine-transporting ATPase 13A3-like isoform X1 [Amphibalanus amphitrite]XP_043214517.1 polyamine-transporting ATPase 13A3-like isoform X1 [Amphibalanus amphitrite]XP_043214518.1 polyamine-transporting ATPase 13A3-like isoform X1 [Amphibalanus amphitrite]XP_043214520.1 polyamine-transporting ATPase 13A3-like isoform X1 [Amphibalanus amphitrite]
MVSKMISSDTVTSGFSNIGPGGEDQTASVQLLGGGFKRPSLGTKQKTTDGDESAVVLGFRRSAPLTALLWLAVLLTAGLLRLLLHWRPDWMLRCTHRRCHLRHATSVLVIERYKKYTSRFIHVVRTKRSSPADVVDEEAIDLEKPRLFVPDMATREFRAVTEIRFFRHKKLCHLWNNETERFERLEPVFTGQLMKELHNMKPLSVAEQDGRRAVFGDNNINLQLTPLLKIIFLEVLSPFYVFQVFACLLWFLDEYEYYATAIVVASTASVTAAVYQQRKNEKNLRRTIHVTDVVEVVRDDDSTQVVPADCLVPGDIIVVPSHKTTLCCDAVLLTGNVIVNESMLTGESVPVTKVPLPADSGLERYSPQLHGRHTLFSGTQLLQTRYYKHERVLAVVTQTGFMTSKGQLVRSILYPPPVDFELQQDSYKFIGVLACVAIVGVIYSSYTKAMRDVPASDIALDVLDLVTIVVPPALPYAMAVGIIVGVERLSRRGIFCISPRSVNLAGLIDIVCFDKTGTLTEDGLDLKGVVRVSSTGDPPGAASPDSGPGERQLESVSSLPVGLFTTGMAACHGLILINGELTGDPLDLKMFESTGWQLEEPEMDETSRFDVLAPTVVRPPAGLETETVPEGGGNEGDVEMDQDVPFEVGIVRQFVFSSSLQRMSVLTRRLGAKHMELFCKGSPEMIMSLSDPETVPASIRPVLDSYTQHGFRVLALGQRPLPKLSYARAQRISREEVECQLTFLGLLVFENRLKPQSRPVLQELYNADIRTVMVTGDNMLTALSVAHDSGLLPAGVPVVSISVAPAALPGDGPPPLVYRLLERTAPCPAQSVAGSGDGAARLALAAEPADYRLAVTGSDWEAICRYHPALVPRLAVRGAVFARMRPEQKQQLIERVKELGYHVGMCGDGANDCGALKAAHTGVSLSEAEASVASPFTSRTPDIGCVPNIVREGRAALVTSFGVFKYMAAYSLTQFISVIILYEKENALTDFQFLYIDMFLIMVFSGLFSLTRAYPGPLSRQRPSASLVSVTPILSLVCQIALVAGVQIWANADVQRQPWYIPYKPAGPDEDDDFASHENFAVYSVSSFQYIWLVLVFSRAAPFRRPLYTNLWFSLSILINLVFCAWCVVHPADWMASWLELLPPPSLDWRLKLAGVAVAQLVVAMILEYGVVEALVTRRLLPRLGARASSRPAHTFVSDRLAAEAGSWPPLSAAAAPAPAQQELSAEELMKRLPPAAPAR